VQLGNTASGMSLMVFVFLTSQQQYCWLSSSQMEEKIESVVDHMMAQHEDVG
jgi:hypothetical protein